MGKILKQIQKNPSLHLFVRTFYGKTFGFWKLKELYIRKIGISNGEKRLKLTDNEAASKIISRKIKSGKPFMVARYGSTEFRNIINDDHFDSLCIYSGFFPNDKKLLSRFRKEYMSSSKMIDFLCIWNYRNNFFKKIKLLKRLSNIKGLFELAVVGHDHSWVSSLEGKRVLIIHPFKKTILSQYKKTDKLRILPKLKNLDVIKAVQTLAGNKDSRFENWFEALDFMKEEIERKEFDIALIGCGAYGLPLAAHVKSLGKQAIHVGGGLQLFFGIKGKRWDTDPLIEYGKDWVYPMKEDFINAGEKVEGGCYW